MAVTSSAVSEAGRQSFVSKDFTLHTVRCRNTQLLCIDLVIFALVYEENTRKY